MYCEYCGVMRIRDIKKYGTFVRRLANIIPKEFKCIRKINLTQIRGYNLKIDKMITYINKNLGFTLDTEIQIKLNNF
jgi:hypothetical protein